jgi:methylated-DNA-[protein]-cysteine S-methyltransferase
VYTVRTSTPAGTLLAVADEDDAVLAAGFTDDDAGVAARLGLPALPPDRTGPNAVADAVARYLGGDLAALDDVAVRQPGTPFQHQVWAALRDTPPGEPATYGELAARIGRPGATRAVGSACARNLVAPFIPCHRAVRAGGGAGRYLYGSDVKRWLLAHERRLPEVPTGNG